MAVCRFPLSVYSFRISYNVFGSSLLLPQLSPDPALPPFSPILVFSSYLIFRPLGPVGAIRALLAVWPSVGAVHILLAVRPSAGATPRSQSYCFDSLCVLY